MVEPKSETAENHGSMKRQRMKSGKSNAYTGANTSDRPFVRTSFTLGRILRVLGVPLGLCLKLRTQGRDKDLEGFEEMILN